ncbi:MAG: WD40 repeat protein, partial [Myxococcota bacterium]
ASALTVRITGGITALTITPEGLAAGTDRGDVVGVADGREVYRLTGHRGRVSALAALDDRLVSGGEDGRARYWHAGQPLAETRLNTPIRALCTAADRVWIGGADGSVAWWQPRAEVLSRCGGPGAEITALAASADGSTVATGDAAGVLCAWEVSGGHRVLGAGAPVVAVARVGLHLVVARADGSLSALLGAVVVAFQQVGPVERLAADGDRVWSTLGRTARAWRVPDLTPAAWQPGPGACIGVVVATEGQLWTGDGDGALRAWDVPWPVGRPALGHDDAVRAVAFGPGLLASGGKDGLLRVWDPETGAQLARHAGHDGGVEAVDVRLGDIATAGADGTVRLWSGDADPVVIRASVAQLSAVRLVDDLVVSAGHDGVVHVHDRSTGLRRHALEGHSERVRALARHRSGVVASGGYDGVLAVWDTREGTRMGHVNAHPGPIIGLCAAGDGWATASLDGTVGLWDPASTRLATLRGHTGGVTGVAMLGPARLVSVGLDGTVRLWSMPGGELLQVLDLGGPLTGVAADGRHVAVATRSGDVVTLALEPAER